MLGCEVASLLKKHNLAFTGTDREVDITDFKILKDYVLTIQSCSKKSGKSFSSQTSLGKIEKITHIINCAGYTNVDKAETESLTAKKINEIGTENIAKVASLLNATLIHISTDYVFDGSEKNITFHNPIKETEAPCPCSVYGKTKALGELGIIKNLTHYYILRTSWLYGPYGKNFVFTMIEAMCNHNSISVVNDQIGSPTNTYTLASVIINLINREIMGDFMPYGIYHCSDLGEISWYDFAVEIRKLGIEKSLICNKNCKLKPCSSEEYKSVAKRPKYSVLSKDKIQKALGIQLPLWHVSLKSFFERFQTYE